MCGCYLLAFHICVCPVLCSADAGTAASASLTPLTARLVYNNTVLLEKAVGPNGEVLFDKVDFNQPPERYNLTLELSPGTDSALAADVSGRKPGHWTQRHLTSDPTSFRSAECLHDGTLILQ